jgi:nickel-dependent lactate racemase
VEADRVILTGSIHHHVIAGFSAGPKSLLPGVAARESIQSNHALVLNPVPGKGLNPNCAAGKLAGNPMQADITEAYQMFPKPVFLLNIVPAQKGGIYEVVAGDVISAHRQGCKTAETHYGVPLSEKRKFVLASCGGYPLDMVFYQSTKGLINLSQVLKSGGVGVLLAQCKQGIGADSFVEWLDLGSPERIEARLRDQFTVPGLIALTFATLARRATIVLISDLPVDLVKKLGLIPAPSPEVAMRIAVGKVGKTVSGYYMDKASVTVPKG